MTHSPDTTQAIADLIRTGSGKFLPTGAGTKPGLIASGEDVQRVDMRSLSGIVSYDPSEFLITARAGTRIEEVVARLAANQQYLPFDPMFISRGATLGGTLASGISGPSRLLYGSLRDFVMELELVDGGGSIVRGGGKVVKNAAGFDLPKLLVGSYGRLGIVTEITLKVFPSPQATSTLICRLESYEQFTAVAQDLIAMPLPIAALELDAEQNLVVRLAGPEGALSHVLTRVRSTCRCDWQTVGAGVPELLYWQTWKKQLESTVDNPNTWLVRVATELGTLPNLMSRLSGLAVGLLGHSCAGAVTWLKLSEPTAEELLRVDQLLSSLKMPAVAIAGPSQELSLLGDKTWLTMARRIQRAMDPSERFVSF
jgi:glycolate oxidase FAD binding subunit